MNKEQLEKMFDQANLLEWDSQLWCWILDENKVKQFIFDEIIPKVLENMLVYNWNSRDRLSKERTYCNNIIKQKAETLYWITLK